MSSRSPFVRVSIPILSICILVFSCSEVKTENEDSNNVSPTKQIQEVEFTDVKYDNEKSGKDKSELYTKQAGVVFYSIPFEEQEAMKRRSSDDVKYHITRIFNDFENNIEAVERALKLTKLQFSSSSAERLYFIRDRGDTLYFNPEYEDVVMAQIYFSPDDTIKVYEGLLTNEELRSTMQQFFKNRTIPHFYIQKEKKYQSDSTAIKTDSVKNEKLLIDSI